MADQLPRSLGLWSATALVVGSVIGSSIFMKPAVMADQVGNGYLIILVWIIAGAISLIGANINAELGCMMPVTGGQYEYFKKMYGSNFAFLYGWAAFAVINTASVAAIAYVCADYLSYFITMPRFSTATEQKFFIHLPYVGNFYFLQYIGLKVIASIIVVILTMANVWSARMGGKIQSLVTNIKIGLLIFIVLLIFGSGKGNLSNYTSNLSEKSNWQIVLSMVAALSGAFAAFDGWNNLGFVAGEIKEPHKVIPRALLGGLSICLCLYVLTNMAFLYAVPIDVAARSSLIATDAVAPILGTIGAGLVAAMVAVSTFGATNGNILACSRVTYAMSVDGNFIKSLGKIHPKYATPGKALYAHAIVTVLFIFSGSFDMLTDLFVFVTWIFYGFAAYGIFIMRKKIGETQSSYQSFGYPILPIVFILFTIVYSVLTIYNDVTCYTSGKCKVIKSSLGIVIVLSGMILKKILGIKKENEEE